MEKPKVSIIVVNFNGIQVLIECLKALERQSFKSFELILVDNNSKDDSLPQINNFLNSSVLKSKTKLIELDHNAGFTGGNMAGFSLASGDYIGLLNNDTEPTPDWLCNLVTAMDSDPSVGICASKLILHGTEVIDSAGDGFSTILRGTKRGMGETADLYNNDEYVFGACAGAALYRHEMLDEIGFLDEDFFLNSEDVDINFRAQLSGWKARYVPSAVTYHKVSSTIGHMSDVAFYYAFRNSEFVNIKNLPFCIFLKCLPGYIFSTLFDIIYHGLIRRKLLLYLRAKLDVIKNLRIMLNKRREIMKMKKVDDSYIYRMIEPFQYGNHLGSTIRRLYMREDERKSR